MLIILIFLVTANWLTSTIAPFQQDILTFKIIIYTTIALLQLINYITTISLISLAHRTAKYEKHNQRDIVINNS